MIVDVLFGNHTVVSISVFCFFFGFLFCWEAGFHQMLQRHIAHGITTRIHSCGPLAEVARDVRVIGLWEEAGVGGENSRRHRENVQTSHGSRPRVGTEPREGGTAEAGNYSVRCRCW